MPVLDQATSNNYTGNGVTTVFAYTFRLLDEADVLVTVDGVIKTLTTHYTVSGVGASGGGNITFLSAPANAAEVVIQRDMPYAREADYQENGDLLAETLDEDLDRSVMLVQQIRAVTNRAITIPVADTTGTTVELPVAASRADKALIFDADGNVTVSTDDYEDQLTNVTAQAAAAAASASAASSSASAAASSASSASTSASNASSSASAAATSQSAAAASAVSASTNATNAFSYQYDASVYAANAAASLADALVIYDSIAAVQTAETNAANSATAASTSASNASTSATNAASSASAAASSATSSSTSAGTATLQAAASAASATAAASSATTATNQAAAAAGYAADALSVVEQDLSAIDQSVFAATVVDAFIYDTSKDSDGGAWRHRCGHTSWENETLSGNWLGSAANETAARAISGATTGSMYYDTTAAGFYTLNAGSGKTVTYRGNVRQFPAKVLITVEAARVIIWDLTQAGAPMWMVFATTAGYALHSGTVTSVAAANGQITVGMSTQAIALRFVADRAEKRNATDLTINTNALASRNSAGTWGNAQTSGAIVNAAVNDVAMTVLPGAPVDVATGLPVPTIAVATGEGISVIKDDGNVWDITYSTGTIYGIAFSNLNEIVSNVNQLGAGLFFHPMPTADVALSAASATTTEKYLVNGLISWTGEVPVYLGGGDYTVLSKIIRAGHDHVFGGSKGIATLRRNAAVPASSMVAYITKDYTSGWFPGDIRGAWLADSVAETITGTELVTNGTFATDLSGWTLSQTVTASVPDWNAGVMRMNSDGSGYSRADQSITTVAGKTYVIAGTVAGATQALTVGTSQGGSTLLAANVSVGAFLYSFVATGTTTWIRLEDGAGTASSFDNISCKLADVDRSVKAKGLQINGSLTKAAVASGAQLMGYSGFSAANFLEQPYNSDLDFGTGDFCIMGWVKTDGDVAAVQTLFVRDASGGTASFLIDISASEVLEVGYLGGSFVTITATIPAVASFICVKRVSGTLYVWLNGVQVGSGADTQNWTTKWSSPVTRLGLRAASTLPADETTMALWRASATAPSDEQIKHIYETEKKLFEANANCLLAGSSNAVTALAYDDATDLLHVGTSYGRSQFKGLVRTASEATAIGAITALSAQGGCIAQGGASGADIYVPAYLLREELSRRAEQAAKFGQALVAHDFTATASQTTFTLPVGWEIVAVYQQGSIKRETTSWTRSFDGFKWSAVLGTGATVSDWITILAKRTVQ